MTIGVYVILRVTVSIRFHIVVQEVQWPFIYSLNILSLFKKRSS